MKPYPKYKPSNIPWIGEIPEHWEKSRYKFSFQVMSGNGFPSELQGINAGEYAFYKVSDINGDSIYVNSAVNYVDKKEIYKNRWTIIPSHSILAAKIGEALKKNHRKIITTPCLIDNNMIAFHPVITKANIKYAYYLLKIIDLDWYTNPGTVPSISTDKLKSQELFFPPLSEQLQIAAYLDNKTQKIDKLISNKQKQVELFKEERQAIINNAVTGKAIAMCTHSGVGRVASRGGGGKEKVVDGGIVAVAMPASATAATVAASSKPVKYKPSGIPWLGNIPEQWEVKRLKYIADIISGAAFDSSAFTNVGKVKVLKITNIQHDYIDWSETEYLPASYEKIYKKFKVHHNDIVFALTRPIISTGIKSAKIKLMDDDIVLLNQRNAILRTKSLTDVNFIYFVTHSSYFLRSFELSIDNTGQQPNISPVAIMNFQIIIPPFNEQKRIYAYLVEETKRIDFTISIIEKEITLLQEYRTVLISNVVTGKIDVREELIS